LRYLKRLDFATEKKEFESFIATYEQLLGLKSGTILQGKNVEDLLATESYESFQDIYDLIRNTPDSLARSGVCRDIAVYQSWLANELGIKDSFSATASWRGSAHVISGGRDESGNFFFMNYGDVYQTNHKNFEDAFQEYEQNVMKGVTLVNYISRGEDKGGDLTPIQTRAGEQLRNIATGRETSLGQVTAENLDRGTIHINDALDVRIDRYKTKIGLTKENLQGSTTLQFMRLDNSSDRYNTIRDAIALHLGHQIEFGEKKTFGVKTGLSFVTGVLKSADEYKIPIDEGGGTKIENLPLSQLLLQLNPQVADHVEVTDGVQFRYAFGVEALLALGLTDGVGVAGGGIDLAGGAKLAFIGNNGEIYIGGLSENTLTVADLREPANPRLYSKALDLTAGGKYNFEIDGHKLELGGDVAAGLQGLGRDAVHVQAKLNAALDQQHFLNLKARQILPNTFLVSEKTELDASVATKLGDMTVVDVGYYLKQEEAHATEHGARVGLTLLF